MANGCTLLKVNVAFSFRKLKVHLDSTNLKRVWNPSMMAASAKFTRVRQVKATFLSLSKISRCHVEFTVHKYPALFIWKFFYWALDMKQARFEKKATSKIFLKYSTKHLKDFPAIYDSYLGTERFGRYHKYT